MEASKLRYIFWPLWFIVVPLVAARLALWLIVPTDPDVAYTGIRAWMDEQRIPALIILFTVFEVLLYRWRHDLPLAAQVGLVGRVDVPKALRADYEHAAHLVDEATRILRKHRKNVERALPVRTREDLVTGIDQLRGTLESSHFDADAFADHYAAATKLVTQHLARWRKSELREYGESILIAFAVALLLRAFVLEAFKIPSGSMLPTLQIQDHIFVNKFAYGPSIPFTKSRVWTDMPPERGDVIVFEYPDPILEHPRQDFIKRVIAVPGDTLEVVGGHPVLNGWQVPHCSVGRLKYREGERYEKEGDLFIEYLGDSAYLTLFEDIGFGDRVQGPYKVAPGEVWVLGDNRNNSSDSRAWNHEKGAGAPLENIKGRALFVWMSFAADGSVTWKRLFTSVMGRPTPPPKATPEILEGIERCLAQKPAITLPPLARPSPDRQ